MSNVRAAELSGASSLLTSKSAEAAAAEAEVGRQLNSPPRRQRRQQAASRRRRRRRPYRSIGGSDANEAAPVAAVFVDQLNLDEFVCAPKASERNTKTLVANSARRPVISTSMSGGSTLLDYLRQVLLISSVAKLADNGNGSNAATAIRPTQAKRSVDANEGK